MINWDKERGGGDLTKFFKANKTKKEENVRKINNFLRRNQIIWGDQHIFKI
jgi:hypothetical protein